MKLPNLKTLKLSFLIEVGTFICGILPIWIFGGHAGMGIFVMFQFPSSVLTLLLLIHIPIVSAESNTLWYIPYMLITFIMQFVLIIVAVYYFKKIKACS
jgi:hypothetical protein